MVETRLDEGSAQPCVTAEAQDHSEKSVLLEWVEHLFEDYLNLHAYWRLRRRILNEPAITIQGEREALRKGPLLFALQAQVALYTIASVIIWCIVHVAHLPPPSAEQRISEIDRELADIRDMRTAFAVEEKVITTLQQPDEKAARLLNLGLREQRWRARYEGRERRLRDQRYDKQAEARIEHGVETYGNLLIGAGLLLSATLFRRYLRPYMVGNQEAASADRIYLYYMSACLLAPHAAAAALSVGVDIADRLPSGDLAQNIAVALWCLCLVWAAGIHFLQGRTVASALGLRLDVAIAGRTEPARFVGRKLVRAYIVSSLSLLLAVAIVSATVYAMPVHDRTAGRSLAVKSLAAGGTSVVHKPVSIAKGRL